MSSGAVETTRTRTKSAKTLQAVEGSSGQKTIQLRNRSSSPPLFRMSSRVSVPRVMLVALVGFGVMTYCASVVSRTPQLRASVYHSSYKSSTGELVTPPLVPRSTVIENTEVFFMMPTTETRGVLIFFHGCNHAGGQDMFELPEDRIVALAALNRGLAVLTPTSENRKTGCWGHKDAEALEKNQVVDKWMASVGLSPAIPRMGMGASSGGAFLFSVHKSIGLASMASYVSGRGFSDSELAAGNVPPTMFVYMPKDWRTADKVEETYKALVKAGIPTEKMEVNPHAFTPELCARRLPEFGDRRCRAFYRDILAQGNLVNDKDLTVMTSYHGGDWKAIMEKNKLDAGLDKSSKAKKGMPSKMSFGGHTWMWASMEEEIAASFAVHEMTSEHRQKVLDFLMKHAGIETESKH